MDFREDTLQMLTHLLLCNRIRLEDIPRSIRLSSSRLYVSAFRISRIRQMPCERYIEDLHILCNDILSLKDKSKRMKFVEILSSELDFNEHKGERSFVNFKKTIPKEILLEMQYIRKTNQKNLEAQLRQFKII